MPDTDVSPVLAPSTWSDPTEDEPFSVGDVYGAYEISTRGDEAESSHSTRQHAAIAAYLHRGPDIGSRVIFSAERQNERVGRTLRVVQRELRLVGGQNLQIRIEVLDETLAGRPVIFSVKHAHGNPWGRQMIVHKNLIFAGLLSGVTDLPLEVPHNSRKMFEKTDNPQHMHSYMERVMPHIRSPGEPPSGLRLYWWRACDNGATVLQNEQTGRLLVIPNKGKHLTTAATTVFKALEILRNLAAMNFQALADGRSISMPGASFLVADPSYPAPGDHRKNVTEPDRQLTEAEVKEAVQRWAVNERVSPWMTQFVVRTHGLRKSQVINIRYSIDIDPSDPLALSIQVHSNEPLSRELQAFPICMIPMPIESTRLQDVYVRFFQSVWFLKKLFEFHSDVEASNQRSKDQKSQAALSPIGSSTLQRPQPTPQKQQRRSHTPIPGAIPTYGPSLLSPMSYPSSKPSRPVSPKNQTSPRSPTIGAFYPTFAASPSSTTPTRRVGLNRTHPDQGLEWRRQGLDTNFVPQRSGTRSKALTPPRTFTPRNSVTPSETTRGISGVLNAREVREAHAIHGENISLDLAQTAAFGTVSRPETPPRPRRTTKYPTAR